MIRACIHSYSRADSWDPAQVRDAGSLNVPHSFSCRALSTDIGDTDQPIPLPNVSSNVLKKVCTETYPCRPPLGLFDRTRADPGIATSTFDRSLSTAPTTAATLLHPLTTQRSRADAPPTSRTGTPNSFRSTRKCSSRSSWQLTTSTSSRSLMLDARLCKFSLALFPPAALHRDADGLHFLDPFLFVSSAQT